MPIEGCHNLHRWQKEQNQQRRSGRPPSDPSVPGLLGFEKEQDLQETKVYIRALWLATENARLLAPRFLDNNACKLWKRTNELVTEYTRDEDRLCAELAKDDIVQTDSGSQPCVRSAFLKEDIEHILIDEGFGDLIWGRQNTRSSQLSNPCPGNGERAPKWGGQDRKGRWNPNQQDEILLTVRHWVAARIQNKIRRVPERCDRRNKTEALPAPKKKLGRPRKVEQGCDLDIKKPHMESFSCAQRREQNRQCQHKETHQLVIPDQKRHDSPNEQLAEEIWSSGMRRRNKISVSPVLEQESSEYIDESGNSTEESPSNIQSRKRKRSIQGKGLQPGIFEQLEDVSASVRGIRKHLVRRTAHNGGLELSAVNPKPRRQLSQELLTAPATSQTTDSSQNSSRQTRQKSECSNSKAINIYHQARDTVNSTGDEKSVVLKMDSTEPTSECSSVDFAQFLDADDELSQEGGEDVTAGVRAKDDRGEEEHRNPDLSGKSLRHDYPSNTHSPRDNITNSLLDHSYTSTYSLPTMTNLQIVSARNNLQASLSLTLEQKPNYRSTLATLIPHAKHLYKVLTLHNPASFSPAFEQNELALVYWEVLMTKLLTPTPLQGLKTWHRELLEPWPDGQSFGLEIWTTDLVRFFAVLLGWGEEPAFEAEMMGRLMKYNRALWECFVE